MPPGGYAWWYVDGVSDDGARAVSVIGFVGSVFSPWYVWSGRSDPRDHCCVNVATYGPGARFAMTDRGRAALQQSARTLQVGPSRLHWTGDALVIDIDEIATLPRPGRLRGRITLRPEAVTDCELPLTPDGAHVWRPFAPRARIEVAMDGVEWQGHGYLDANFGIRPLEVDFRRWTWARFPTAEGALCIYDAERRDGGRMEAAIAFDAEGRARLVDAPPAAALSRSFWRIARGVRADPDTRPRDVLSMLDAPFYSRGLVETRIGGATLTGVHEALDLDRFANPIVRAMLAFRIPRRAGWPIRADRDAAARPRD